MISSVSLLQQVVSIVAVLASDPVLVGGYCCLIGLTSSATVMVGLRPARFSFMRRVAR